MYHLASNQTIAAKLVPCEYCAVMERRASRCAMRADVERDKVQRLREENDRLRNQLQETMLLLELCRREAA